MGTSDENELYFCGTTAQTAATNNGDFIFGRLDKTFNFEAVYTYGSPGTEAYADCTLSVDNNYLIGIFSTDFTSPKPSTVIAPATTYVDTSNSNKDLGNPF